MAFEVENLAFRAERRGHINQPILTGRDWRDDIRGTVENTAGGWRDLNGLLVKSAAVHTEAFGSFLVRREDGKTCARGLVLIRRAQRPECNGSTAELSEPTLKLGLCGIVGQAAHVEDLASLGKKGTHVGAGVHGLGEYVGVLLWGLAFAD